MRAKRFQTLALLSPVAFLAVTAGAQDRIGTWTQRNPVLATNAAAELRDQWIDPETGHRILRLSRVPGGGQSLYFHQNGFTVAGDKVIFESSERGTSANRIYAYDFRSRRPELVTGD